MARISYFLLCIAIFHLSSCSIFKKRTKEVSTQKEKIVTEKKGLLDKYSRIIGNLVEDEVLYGFIDEWLGVPYKFGGKTKAGIDCSNFSCELLRKVYSFPKGFYFPSSKIAEQGSKINISKAKEGDVLCFSINQNSKISHIGVYLANGKFVHSSTSSGVIISSLDEDYYKKRFSFAIRLKK